MRGRPPTGWRAPGAIGLAALPSRSGDQDGRHRIWATDAQLRCELCPNPGAIFAQFNLTKHTTRGARRGTSSAPPRRRRAPAARPRAGTRAWPRGGRRAPSCPPTSTRPGGWAARARARGAGTGTRARRSRTATPRPAPPTGPPRSPAGPGAHASPRPGTSLSGGAGQSPAGAGPNPPPLGPRADAPRSRPRKTCLSRPATRPGSPVSLAATPRREAAILAQVLSPLPEWPASVPRPRCGKDIPATSCRTGIRRSTRWDALPATSLIFGVSLGVVRNLAGNYGLFETGSGTHRHALSRCSQTTSEHSLKRPFLERG